jgi:hypothetical protein
MRSAVLLFICLVVSASGALAQDAEAPAPGATPIVCDAKALQQDATGVGDNDRFAGLRRVMDACTAQWQGLDRALEKDLPQIGQCGYSFQTRFTEVLRIFEFAITAKKNYYESWKKSVEEDSQDLDRFAALQQSSDAEVAANLAQEKDELKSRTDRLAALIDGAGGDRQRITDPLLLQTLKALDDLIEGAKDTMKSLEGAGRNATETGEAVKQDRQHKADLLASIIQESRGVAAERLLWKSYYDLRKARISLGCDRDGPKKNVTITPGQNQ